MLSGSAGMAAARVGARRHCCVRLLLREKDGKRIELSRLDFSRKLLAGVLQFVPGDINCLVVLPQGQGFDVSFRTPQLLMSFWNKLEKVKEKFAMFNIEKLTDTNQKFVVLRMFNETVECEDICTWLANYCLVKGPAQKIVDVDGIWTGSWKVPVRLHDDPTGYGGVRHLPSLVVIGENRGLVHYQGQAKLCRRCGAYGHLAEGCELPYCSRCRQVGHVVADCRTGVRCNLCNKAGHLFRDCPDSYANRTRRDREEDRRREEAARKKREEAEAAENPAAAEEGVGVAAECSPPVAQENESAEPGSKENEVGAAEISAPSVLSAVIESAATARLLTENRCEAAVVNESVSKVNVGVAGECVFGVNVYAKAGVGGSAVEQRVWREREREGEGGFYSSTSSSDEESMETVPDMLEGMEVGAALLKRAGEEEEEEEFGGKRVRKGLLSERELEVSGTSSLTSTPIRPGQQPLESREISDLDVLSAAGSPVAGAHKGK